MTATPTAPVSSDTGRAAGGGSADRAVAAAPRRPVSTPSRRAAAPPASGPSAAALAAEEKAWERTHLEQVMFRLAREHAEAAARCAAATPPDRDGERTHSLLSVLMAYFAVEAFINMVGQDRLGGRFRHYDRMSPEGKWLEVTRLVSKTGRTFDDDGKELSALSTLRSWRNTLTHYKGRYEDTQTGRETQVDALLSAEHAKQAVDTATMLYRAFYELDRRSPPRQFVWLDDREPTRPAAAPRTSVPSSRPSPAPAASTPAGPAVPAPPRRRRRRGGRGRQPQKGAT
ncbi:MAG TPA: hypothetical protein VKT83_16440 [bacterium]|nr:hypothetical protein [bacterium]